MYSLTAGYKRIQTKSQICYHVHDIELWVEADGNAGCPFYEVSVSEVIKVSNAYGGWAKGIPRNSDTSPDLTPVNVASSRVTLGDDVPVGMAITMFSDNNRKSKVDERSILKQWRIDGASSLRG